MIETSIILIGCREFISRYPERLHIDTVEFEGKKEIRQSFTRGGIDLPGTFLGISSSKVASEKYSCFERETSLAEWKKVSGIVTATVTLSNQIIHTPLVKKTSCVDSSIACRAQELLDDFMDETGLNGVQVCVSKNNNIVWSAALGYADVENNIPVTDSTRFRINSVSKSMTSVALMKLVSEGKLNLDSPIQIYVQEFPLKKWPFTTRQLAGHLAGIRDYNEKDLSDFIRTEHFSIATEAIRIFKDDSLLFKPGSKFHYSTFGWNLLGAVIEGISGKSYLAYMQQNIWQPMDLRHTCGDNLLSAIPNRSKFYDLTGQVNDLGDWSYKYSGGGLLSTADDLVKFGNELLYGEYIDKKLKKILFETQVTSNQKETGYGIGWYIGKDKNGHRIWHHAGDSFSSSSYLMIYPDDDLVIAFLANSQVGAAFDIQSMGALFYLK